MIYTDKKFHKKKLKNLRCYCRSDANEMRGKRAVACFQFAAAPMVKKMSEIIRLDVNEEWAHTGIIKAGDFCFLNYCVGNVGGTIEEQIHGAFDEMEKRLALFGLSLEHVVQMDCLFRDIWNIPIMEKVIKERFHGKYPTRKSIQTEFAHTGGEGGLQFQVDAVAYCGNHGN